MKKIFLKAIFTLIVMLICTYFLITSSFFIKSILLPVISNFAGVKISVSAIEISPIRGQFSFDNMALQKDNLSTDIGHFDTQLNIFDLFLNKLTVNNLNLENSYLRITQAAYSDHIEQQRNEKDKQETNEDIKSIVDSKPYNFFLRNIKIVNLNIVYSLTRKNSQTSSISEIKNLNINIPCFETDGKGTLDFSSDLTTSSGERTLSGSIQGNIDAIIRGNGIPENFDLKTTFKLGQNTTPITCRFNSKQKGKAIPFAASLNINDLPLQPFFQTFVKGTYKETNGYISSLNINTNAPDLYNKNILQTLNGNLIFSAKNIYIPSDLLRNPLAQIMLIPLEVISKFDNAASFKLFSSNSDNIKLTTSKIISGEKLLEFKTGEIKLSMKNGDTNISNFEFIGTPRSAIQKIIMTGTINKNQQINLNTITKISEISIPLRLKGTLTNPQHEQIELIRELINQNTGTINKIIDATTKDNNIKQTTKNIINTINNITKEDNNKTSGNKENPVENLLKGIKNLTD